MMPEMDGFEFLAEFRKNPKFASTPVIVVTAADLSLADRRRLDGGVEHILQKAASSQEDFLRQIRESRRALCRRGGLQRDGWLTMVKILYVEDNEDNLYMLSNRLTRRGYEVVSARDGEQGIAMAAARRRRSFSWI